MRSRPAESLTAASALAVALARLVGLDDPDVITGLAVAVGLLPALVTAVVEAGGVVGVARRLWRGTGGT